MKKSHNYLFIVSNHPGLAYFSVTERGVTKKTPKSFGNYLIINNFWVALFAKL